jgi:hypothetical protein
MSNTTVGPAVGPIRHAHPRRRLLVVVGGLAGGALVAAVALAVAAARHAHPSEHSPVAPSGAWGPVWIGSVAAALAFYGLGTVLASRGRVGLRVALATAAVVQVVPFAGPLLLSSDVYGYWAQARVVTVYHENPYTVTAASHPRDAAVAYASPHWAARKPEYGPGWEAVGTLPALAAGTSAHRAELGYRVLAVLGILAAVAIVAASTRSAASVVLVGWSPLVALHYAGGGHNDAWMVALMLLAVAGRSSALGGVAWPLAAAFKPVPVVVLPLELARTRLRATRRFWIGLATAATAVAGGSLAAFGTSWITPALAATHGSTPLGGVYLLTQTGLRHRYAIAVASLAFAAVYAALLRSAWRSGRARTSLATSALCMAASQLRPWYGLWPTALAAVEEDRLAALTAYALTVYLVVWDAIPL